jgi:tRNA threonylcarbamoyladenosine biosynthesis protein TsaE
MLAAKLARSCHAGDCIALRGDLGAGKTTFARGFIRALSPTSDEIVSPTFTLVQTYPAHGGDMIWHFDLYRLTQAAEAEEIGLHEALQEGITLIEWPELVAGTLPADTLDICLAMGNHPGQRTLTLAGLPAAWHDRLEALKGN